jgi:type I restriction enzyme S subunit
LKSEIEVPEGWGLKSVGDLFDVKNGITPSTKQLEYWENGSINWFTPADLSKLHGKNYVNDSNRKITKTTLDKCNLTLMPLGSLIVSCRAPVGYVAILNEKAAFNQGCKGLIAKSSSVDYTFYLYCLLCSKKKLQAISGGSTFKELSKSAFLKFKVPYPPLPEQQKIADILSKVDEQIQQTEEIIEKTEELKKGLMQKLLTKGIGHTRFKQTELGDIPEEWRVIKLDECAEQKKETILPSGEGKTIYVGLEHIDTGVPWLTRYGMDCSIKSLKFKFTKNNILYGKLRPYLDKAVLTTKEGICSTDIVVIQSKENSLNEFILPILHSKRFLDYANSTTKGSNLPRTSWTSISKFNISLPLLSEQQRIAKVFTNADNQLKDNHDYLLHLKQLKKGLMQDLLTGRVRVTV